MAFKAHLGGNTGLSGEQEATATLGLFGLSGAHNQGSQTQRQAGALFQSILGRSMDTDGCLAPTAKNPWHDPNGRVGSGAPQSAAFAVRITAIDPTSCENGTPSSSTGPRVPAGAFTLDAEGRLLDGDGRPVLGLAPRGTSVPNHPLQTDRLGTATLDWPMQTAPRTLGVPDPSLAAYTRTPSPIVVPLSLTGSPTTLVHVTATLGETALAESGQPSGEACLPQTITIFDASGQTHTMELQLESAGDGLFTWTAEMDGGEALGGTPGVPMVLGSGQLQLTEGTGGEALLVPLDSSQTPDTARDQTLFQAGLFTPTAEPNSSGDGSLGAHQSPQATTPVNPDRSLDAMFEPPWLMPQPREAPIIPVPGAMDHTQKALPAARGEPSQIALVVDFADTAGSQTITLHFGVAAPSHNSAGVDLITPSAVLSHRDPTTPNLLGTAQLGQPASRLEDLPLPTLAITLEAVDGTPPGALVELTIDRDGNVTGHYSNGVVDELATLTGPSESEDLPLLAWDPSLPAGLGTTPLASATVATAAEMVEGALGRLPLAPQEPTTAKQNLKEGSPALSVHARHPEASPTREFRELMQQGLKGSAEGEFEANLEPTETTSDDREEAESFALALADALGPPPAPPHRPAASDAWQSAVGAMTEVDRPVENRGAARAAALAFEGNLGLENPSRVQIRLDVGEAGETACIVERQGPNLKVMVSSADPRLLSLLESQRHVMVETLRSSGQVVSTLQIVRMEEAGTNLAQSFGQTMKRPKTRGTEDDERTSSRTRRNAPRINVTG